MKKVCLMIVVLMIISSIGVTKRSNASDCNWLCFMGNNGHTGVAQSGCGPKSGELKKVWEFKAGSQVRTSVIVDGNYAFFGSCDGNFYCVDALKGTKNWQYIIGESCENSDGDSIGGCSSTAAVSNERVYFGTICGKIVCLDEKTGKKNWEYDNIIGGSYNSAVVVENNKVYAINNEWLYCLDATTGTKLWDAIALDNQVSSPAIADGKIYVGAMYFMKCYDANTGKSLVESSKFWTSGESILGAQPAYKNGKVYFGCLDSDFHRFDAYSGERDWEAKYGCVSSICVYSDNVVFGDYLKRLVCLSEANGSTKWTFSAEDYIISGAIYYDNAFYFGSMSGTFYKLDMSGNKLWSCKFNGGIFSAPSVANGCIYITSKDGTVACFSDNSQNQPAKITVSVPKTNLTNGESIQCSAQALNKNGDVVDATITWSVEPTYLGTITQDGYFTAGSSSGKVTIKACVGSICGKAEVQIKNVEDNISTVEITPPSSVILIGADYQFSATAYDIFNAPVDGVKFFWSVDPQEYGIINSQGLFTPRKEGDCNIVAKAGKVINRLKITISKVANLEMKPDKASVAPGAKVRFVVTVFDNKGNSVENPSLSWSVEPYYIGSIDNYGTFTAASDAAGQIGNVIVEGYGLRKTAEVTVVENKKPEIKLDKLIVDFGTIDSGQTSSAVFTINNLGNATDKVNISSSSTWLMVTPSSVDVEPGGKVDFAVNLVKDQMIRGSRLEGVVTVTTTSGFTGVVVVKVVVSNKAPTCFEAKPTELYFGKVSRGKIVSLPLKVKILSKIPVSGQIKADDPWIDVTPSVFSNTSGSIDIIVKVNASMLPSLDDFEGSFQISSNQDCDPLTVKVSGSTEKQINIKLTLNKKDGKINNNDIELDVPPQKVKGRTLVPIRFLSEAFGCTVEWEAKEGRITIARKDFQIVLFKDKLNAMVGGVEKTLDVPPMIISGRTLVPLRFIAEAFGATVNFNSAKQEIDIEWVPQ